MDDDEWREALNHFEQMKALSLDEKVEYSINLIKKALKEHKCCVACSFGKDSTVVLHLALQVDPGIEVVFSNTKVEHKETYEFRDKLVKEWNLNYTELEPYKTFWQCVREFGYPDLRIYSLSRHKKGKKSGTPKCCYYLKEKPASDYYKKEGIEGVILGITWDESYQRRWSIIRWGDYKYSKKKKTYRILPIAYWNTLDVWQYIEKNDLPWNKAYEYVDRVGCITCLPSNTIVYGDNVPIAELSTSNTIMSKSGYSNPTKIMRRFYEGKVIVIKPRSLPEFKITPEHPVLVAEKRRIWFKTNRIRIRPNKRDFYYTGKRILTKPYWKPANELEIGDLLLIPRKKTFNGFNNKELAWLMGLYLAEGWYYVDELNRHLVTFAFGKHEKDLIEKIVGVLRRQFNSGFTSERRSTMNVHVCGKKPYTFFSSCGKSNNKRIPKLIKEAKTEIVKAFLEGYIAGDGYVNKKQGKVVINTSNSGILVDVIELLTMNLGILPYIYKRENQPNIIEGRKVNAKPCYYIEFTKNAWDGFSTMRCKHKVDENFVYVPTTKISTQFVREYVYNLKTPDETYCIPFVVHNCTGFLGWEKQMAQLYPGLYKKIASDLGKPPLSKFGDWI